MTSRQLIAAEANNTDRIALYREGLFWKAYERSAYALCTQVRPFKPTRKVLKTLAGGDIVSVGFPTRAADRILAGLVRIDESSLSCISNDSSSTAACEPSANGSVDVSSSALRMLLVAPHAIDESDFRAWKSALPISLSIPRPSAADVSCEDSASADAFRSASTFAASADRAVSGGLATVANGETFTAPAPQPRLWSRLGGWLVRWATGSDASPRAAAGISDTAAADCILDALRNFEVADKTPMECMMFIADLKKQLLKI